LGYVVQPGTGPFRAHAHAGFGFAGNRLTGGLALTYRLGTWLLELAGGRSIRDFADEPAVSRVVNSFLAQEGGKDYGDYVRLDELSARVASGRIEFRAAYIATDSLSTAATPVWGTYRPNPDLSSGNWWVGGLTLRGRTGAVVGASLQGTVDVEGGLQGDRRYARVRGAGEVGLPAGPGELRLQAWAGWGSVDLPPHRLFVLGGRGTLVGEPLRAYGGRRAALARLSWGVPLPAPAIPLGRYASTGRQLVVAPFVSVGWAAKPAAGLPWADSDGGRPVLGVTVEAFHRLLLLEVGWAVRQETVGFTVDLRRDLWPIL
jgi:hypothetical protein